jgi:adenosine deaminase
VKRHGLPLTIHAGETENSEGISGLDSIREALALGADRIGHGLQAIRDPALLKQLAQRQIPIELCPWSNVQLHSVPSYSDHPLPSLQKEGLNVSLSTDNRMISNITLRQQLAQIYTQGLLPCWEQVKMLTLNGIRGAFISPWEKAGLKRAVLTDFTQVETRYRAVINRFFCKTCTHPKSANLTESAQSA